MRRLCRHAYSGWKEWSVLFSSKTKQLSSSWKSSGHPRLRKPRHMKSNVNTMLIFFLSKGSYTQDLSLQTRQWTKDLTHKCWKVYVNTRFVFPPRPCSLVHCLRCSSVSIQYEDDYLDPFVLFAGPSSTRLFLFSELKRDFEEDDFRTIEWTFG